MTEIIRDYERVAYQYADLLLCTRCYSKMSQSKKNEAALHVTRTANAIRDKVPRLFCGKCHGIVDFVACSVDQSIKGGKMKITLTGKLRERVKLTGYLKSNIGVVTQKQINDLNAKLIAKEIERETRERSEGQVGGRERSRTPAELQHADSQEIMWGNYGADSFNVSQQEYQQSRLNAVFATIKTEEFEIDITGDWHESPGKGSIEGDAADPFRTMEGLFDSTD